MKKGLLKWNFSDLSLTSIRSDEMLTKGKVGAKNPAILREYDIFLDFTDDFRSDETILNFLANLGFSIKFSGTKHLFNIISTCVKNMSMPSKLGDFYKITQTKFGVTSRKAIEIAIVRAIAHAGNTANLERLNHLFNCEYIKYGYISAGAFIKLTCSHFIMYKRHSMGLTAFQ